MDADYGRNFGEDGNFFTDFGHSLLVLTTVQSVTVSTYNGKGSMGGMGLQPHLTLWVLLATIVDILVDRCCRLWST